MKPLLLALSLFCFCGIAFAQPPDYPQEYFRNPLGIPILLAGNFGECRPNHFHSGIDIKTAGRENQPVYAAADGYISRIKMEPGGFGHGLYITHPNGYTTLYAHLNNFMPALQQYVRRQQYGSQSWTQDLVLKPDQFPVKKGQQIAFSGNTGGSTAPHLHFEIRDTKTEHPLNPQLFGFEVKDTRAPVPLKLAIYEAGSVIYEDEPQLIGLAAKGGYYRPKQDTILIAPGGTGLGLVVNDFMDGSTNTLAYYTAEWYVDEVLQGRIRLNDIGYDETHYVNAFADYRTKFDGGPWIQLLFRLPGNRLTGIYESLNKEDGIINPTSNKIHKVRIILNDVPGNISEIRFIVRNGKQKMNWGCDPDKGTLEVDSKAQHFPYFTYDHTNFFCELDGDLYANTCSNFRALPQPGKLSDRYSFILPKIPAKHTFNVKIKPNIGVPFSLRNKIAMIYNNGKKESGQAAAQEDKGWYKASVRAFGEYRLEVDTAAPVITPLALVKGDLSKAKKISFVVKDAMTSVKTFRGELDGTWILFEQHESNWFYEMDSHCPKGPHTLVVKASDENGNTSAQTYTFTR